MTTPQQPNPPQTPPTSGHTPPQGSPFDAPPAPPQGGDAAPQALAGQYPPPQPPQQQYAPQAPAQAPQQPPAQGQYAQAPGQPGQYAPQQPQQYVPQPPAPQQAPGGPPQGPPPGAGHQQPARSGGYGSPEAGHQQAPSQDPRHTTPHGGHSPGAGVGTPVSGVTPYQSTPAAKTHLGHALASEWTKIRSVRSTVWALVAMFITSVGIGGLVGVGVNTADHAVMAVLAPNFFGLMFGQLAIITLGVLVITSEYTTGMIRTTMTACPQRSRVLTAKAIIFFLLSFGMTLMATTITALFNSSMLTGKELQDVVPNDESEKAGELVATSSEWLQATVGASLYVALLGVFALALGALLRSAPAAITIMLGLVLLPFVVSFFLMISERTMEISETVREYSPLNGLSTLHQMSMSADPDASGWSLLALLAAATAVLLVAAYTRLTTRDV